MSATDELRRMLDERGVKWWPSDDSCCEGVITHWRVGPFQWTAIEGEKDLWLNAGIAGHEPLTPAQAIAATVGRETCELVNAGDGKCICFECGYKALDELWSGFKYCPGCGKRVVE